MAPKMRHIKMKRLLQEHQAGDHNDRERMQEIYDCQNLYTSVTKAEGSESRTSQCNNVNVFQHQKKRLRSDEGNVTAIEKEYVFSNPNSNVFATGQATYTVGQAVYQRSRQVSTMTYEDSGDNIHTCSYCNASFWFGEALKRSSSNEPLIYTNCCKKGQIRLEKPKPTPAFLEKLLDPNNGLESRLFRENIIVYNSMFSFTSMGAAIDYKINTGSGPYVFKISGQVHHLMGSILPSNGECPKYAQLYIYIYMIQKMRFQIVLMLLILHMII